VHKADMATRKAEWPSNPPCKRLCGSIQSWVRHGNGVAPWYEAYERV